MDTHIHLTHHTIRNAIRQSLTNGQCRDKQLGCLYFDKKTDNHCVVGHMMPKELAEYTHQRHFTSTISELVHRYNYTVTASRNLTKQCKAINASFDNPVGFLLTQLQHVHDNTSPTVDNEKRQKEYNNILAQYNIKPVTVF